MFGYNLNQIFTDLILLATLWPWVWLSL